MAAGARERAAEQQVAEDFQKLNRELQTLNAELHRRVTAQEELEQELETLLGALEIGVVFLCLSGEVRRINQAAADAFLFDEESRPAHLREFEHAFPELDLPVVFAQIAGDRCGQRYEVRAADGRDYRVRCEPVINAAQDVRGVQLLLSPLSN